jgi:predicted RNase H-like HicB family nuclease
MSKPNYRVSLSYDSDRKVFVARAPELEHCTAEGATRAEAISRVEEEIDAQLANMLAHGTAPPRSVDEEVFSGELSCKVSRLLHRDLMFQARAEGVDLDHLLGELLAAAVESRKHTHRAQRGGNRHAPEPVPHDNFGNRHEGGQRRQGGFGGGRGGYHSVMEDRANFIEYVRGLEQGGHGGGRGPAGHSGHGHGGMAGGDRRGRRRGRGGGGGGGHRPDHRGPQAHGGQPNGAPRTNGNAPATPPPAEGESNQGAPPAGHFHDDEGNR